MARQTKRQQEWALEDLERRESLRAIAQTVDCPGCEQPAGHPCRNYVGEPLGRMDHPGRLNRARAQTVDCPACRQPAGEPCVDRSTEPLGRAGYHARRFNQALATEDLP